MSVYQYYIDFTVNSATASDDITYLNNAVYVAYTTHTSENWATVYSSTEVEALNWLDDTEKTLIKKAFTNGLSKLYIRGAYATTWGKDGVLALSKYLLDGVEVDVHNIAWTLIISPRWGAQTMPDGFKGVLVNSTSTIPTAKPAENIVLFYDVESTTDDATTYGGNALAVMSKFLSATTFKNYQLSVFTGLNAIPQTGLIKTLKDMCCSFLFLDDAGNEILGMFSAGGKEITYPYVSELWRYSVRDRLRKWMQVENPTYIDSNILAIEDMIDKVSAQFVKNGYFASYVNTVAPLRDDQLSTDIDSFLVNNVTTTYTTAGAIWGISVTVDEE